VARNEFYFQIDVSQEQIELASRLVDYSIEHHPISDIFANDPDGKTRQREFRFTGTLGEIVFADAYGLMRPTKSFGAIGGQDFGQDFILPIGISPKSFDVKTMNRKNDNLRANFVLNLPAYQMQRGTVVTDYYCCISIHQNGDKYIASFLGNVYKNDVKEGRIGILYKANTRRIKNDGGSFVFQRDTYEVEFKDISSPIVTDKIKSMSGFRQKTLLPPYRA